MKTDFDFCEFLSEECKSSVNAHQTWNRAIHPSPQEMIGTIEYALDTTQNLKQQESQHILSVGLSCCS